MANLMETQKSSEILYEGKILNLEKDEVLLPNGEPAVREVIRHPGGVCVVPLMPDTKVVMVKQCRYPYGEILTEIPAGKLNWGEDPLECGKRELKEETGIVAEKYLFLGQLYPTPAYNNEVIYMYLAMDLTFEEQKLDEGEFLEVCQIPLEMLMRDIMEGKIKDAKTQTALLKVKFILEHQKK